MNQMTEQFKRLIDAGRLDAVLNKTKHINPRATHRGRHALHKYKGIVEFPAQLGGGVTWLKSDSALRNYEAKGWKVVWL